VCERESKREENERREREREVIKRDRERDNLKNWNVVTIQK
jgi:hypothetical protein